MHLFPDGFLWGAATAAYQIEGAAAADGKGASIWDTFTHRPGRIAGGDTGDVACDHYHRYREDVALMTDLCLNAYRFSISWPRVLPAGAGQANEAGLDFYDRLVDALLACGIRPFVTLYHWDLPQALQDRGGWASRDTAAAFGDYAALAGRRLGDRVTDWITLNEPFSVTLMGHIVGAHAPGERDPAKAFQVSHHLNLAHGDAVRALRIAGPNIRVGIAHVSLPVDAASESEADRAAARRFDGFTNRWFWDPTLRGTYPGDMLEHLGALAPRMQPGDAERMSPRVDFFGHNSYTRALVADDPDAPLTGVVPVAPVGPQTDMGWEIHPAHLYESLTRITREYDAPDIYITENGAAFADEPTDGRVEDPLRVEYLASHLEAAHQALSAGVRLRGYFCWSLLDNFEWSFGYSKRFGIVYVDFQTQRRFVKASGRFLAAVAAGNALP